MFSSSNTKITGNMHEGHLQHTHTNNILIVVYFTNHYLQNLPFLKKLLSRTQS